MSYKKGGVDQNFPVESADKGIQLGAGEAEGFFG